MNVTDHHRLPLGTTFTFLLSTLFFLSGVSALMYEVAWIRLLGLHFGTSHIAITTILASYMSGLSGGYYWGTYLLRNKGKKLFLYGILELFIALYGLTSLQITQYAHLLANQLPTTAHFGLSVAIILQSLCGGMVLLPATIAMGATLPLVTQALSHFYTTTGKKRKGHESIALLYGANTAGAILGVAAATFGVLPLLGLKACVLIAAVLNVSAGTGGFILSRWEHLPEETEDGSGIAKAKVKSSYLPELADNEALLTRVVVAAYVLSGALSMWCEIAWTRGIILAFGSSVYAYAIVLISFLAGIALGSFLHRKLPDISDEQRFFMFCLLELGVALGIALSMGFIGYLSFIFLSLFQQVSQNVLILFTFELLISILILIIPTAAMGLLFPHVSLILNRKLKSVGDSVGRIGAFNTLGSTAGILSAGFLLIPLIGTEHTLLIASILSLGIALVTSVIAYFRGTFNRASFMKMVTITLTIAILLVALPAWNPAIMSQGIYLYAPQMSDFSLSKLDVLYSKDGWTSQVSVTRQTDAKRRTITSLRINGKVDGSDSNDMKTQRYLALLPLLFNEHASNAFILGLGTGVTLRTTLRLPLQEVVCSEIEGRVVEAAHYFSHVNQGVFDDPRAKIVIGDARNYLQTTGKKFDLIINEPSNPWIRGIANLFSEEFFKLCEQRMRQGGIICQWLHLYGMSLEDVRRAIASFYSVFPYGAVWQGSTGDLLLLGSRTPITRSVTSLQKQYDLILRDIQPPSRPSLLGILSDFISMRVDLKDWLKHAQLNTDDLPVLEFTTPLSLYVKHSKLHEESIFSQAEPAHFPFLFDSPRLENEFFMNRALSFVAMGQSERAVKFLQNQVERKPSDIYAVYNLAMLFLALNENQKAEPLLRTRMKEFSEKDFGTKDWEMLTWAYCLMALKKGDLAEAERKASLILHYNDSHIPAREVLQTIRMKKTSP